MFDSLSDRIAQDEAKETSSRERLIRRVMVDVVSVVLFGGLYLGVSLLE
jgi:hypothetical protein